jgi:uncharacterized membrane protein YeaQ/YmgE (transglycosylase-associated protein family)
MGLAFIIGLLLGGLVIGALARLALPGPDPMSIPATIGLGVAGTFLGGIIGYLILGHWGGGLLAVIGATLLLYLHRRFVQHRPLTGPGARQLPPRN